MVNTFLCRGKEQCCFIYCVTVRSDNNCQNNIFHDYNKALFPAKGVLFLQKENPTKNYSLTIGSIEVHA